jgi:hypothetical protein
MHINNFDEQYANARTQLEKAMRDHNNVVLWGTGRNGKSHLCNELADTIRQNGYAVVTADECKYLDNGFICHTNNLGDIQLYLGRKTFVFINMNAFKFVKNPMNVALRAKRL